MLSEKPIKILFLAANPKNTTPLRLDEEVRDVDEGLIRARKRDDFLLQQKWALRIRDLRRAMLDVQPHIVHFSGHGTTAGIALEDNMGNVQIVSSEALSGLFELFNNQVKCVLLNACYSELQAEAIGQHVDYVIGMKKEISDKAAIEFSVAFYDALGAGRTVFDAFKFGKNAIDMEGLDEVTTPIIHEKSDIKKKD
jgi:hypothetical protein